MKSTPSRPPFTALRFALTLALSATASLTGCVKDEAITPATPRTVLVTAVLPSTAMSMELIGEVRAKQRAEMAFTVPGVVRQVVVETGDAVTKGQLLATLDTTPGQAQLNAAQGDVQRAQASLDEARRKHERMASAHVRNAASDTEWSAAQAELRVAEAALATAVAQRDGLAWQRAQTELRAPFDGVVASRQLEVGQAVGSGAPVILLDGAGREIWFNMPADTPLFIGQNASFMTAQGSVEAQVMRLGSRTEAGGARRGVISAPDGLRVGDTVVVRLVSEAGAGSSVQVPLRAIAGAAGPKQPDIAFRLNPDGKSVERVAVRLGDTHGDTVEVLSGLKAGDQVVVAGGHSLTHGAVVKPVTDLR